MKTVLKNKVLVLLSAFIMLFCGVIGVAFFKAENRIQAKADKPTSAPTLTIESNNVSYSDSIYILYAVSHDGFDGANNEIKMLFWEEVQEDYVVGTEQYRATNEGTAKVKGKDCFIFYSEGLAAKEMTTDIYSRAYVEIDGVAYYSDVMKFSILEYVYTMMEKGGLTTNQQNLFNNMLNYGASAQYQFNHNVDRIANGEYYSITIVNGKLPDGFAHGRYKNKDEIKVKADKAPQGMKFSHWEDEKGIIISYDEHITIELKGNKTYIAVYKDISNVATQLVLTSEIPYDGDVNDIELPTAVSFDYQGETVTLEVTWNTESFQTEQLGVQTLYATLVDQSAYKTYDIEVGGIMMNVTTQPYTYAIDQTTGEYILTGYYGEDTEITLPTSYRNTFITTIQSKAFNKAMSLTKVVIPNTYKKIEQSAFFLCDNIAEITVPFVGETATSNNSWFGWIFGATEYKTQYTLLPLELRTVNLTEGATKIPAYTFYQCAKIEKFNIADTITTIQYQAFYGCTKLTEFTIPDNLTSLNSEVFNQSGLQRVNSPSVDKILALGGSPFGSGADLYIKDKLVTEISVPVGIKSISSCFSYCTSIQKVTLPNTLTSIGNWAFEGCISLNEVIIPDSVTYIGVYSFRNCKMLTNINLPNSITTISTGAFLRCTSLKNITLPESLTTIESQAFLGCTNLQSVVIHDGITNIYREAFRDCESLTTVIIPDSVLSIDDWAFMNCRSLKSVIIGKGVTSIGLSAFLECTQLSEIVIPELVYDIGDSAFSGCQSLSKITILSKRLTNIGVVAFRDCTNLVEIYNLSDLQFSIGSEDFGGIAKYAKAIHTSLDEMSCISIDEDGFIIYTTDTDIILLGYVGAGYKVVIPDGVTHINEKAFFNNQTIASLVIPNSVKNIGDNAFGGCYKLVEIINKSENITITKGFSNNGDVGYYALDVYNSRDTFVETKLSNDNGYIIYNEGEEKILVGYIGTEINLVLPSYITTIRSYAFTRCSVVSINIPNSVTAIEDRAIYECYSLLSVVIGKNVVSIGDYAFYSCPRLISIIIPENVQFIGHNVFRYCDDLKSIIFVDSTNWYKTTNKNDMENKINGEYTDLTDANTNEQIFSICSEYYWYKL